MVVIRSCPLLWVGFRLVVLFHPWQKEGCLDCKSSSDTECKAIVVATADWAQAELMYRILLAEK